MLATLVLYALLAPPADAPPAKPAPMSVEVRAKADADAATQSWAGELRAALAARPDEFRLAKPGEKAELVVRLESLGQSDDGTPSLHAALVVGDSTRPFTYGYRDVKADAAKLARNLRKLADQVKASGP